MGNNIIINVEYTNLSDFLRFCQCLIAWIIACIIACHLSKRARVLTETPPLIKGSIARAYGQARMYNINSIST